MNQFKTAVLLSLMTALLLIVGDWVGGHTGLWMMLILSLVMNFASYWYSGSTVLKAYQAVPIQRTNNPELYGMVERLAQKAGLPMPGVYLIASDTPNAFATGRNPQHAAVAVTTGLLSLLQDEEVEGVLAHELTHVQHRDTLIGTVAASLAGILVTIAQSLQWMAIFHQPSSEEGEGAHPASYLLLAVLLPIAATLIQMGISRSREYLADERGARISGKPLALASALAKIDWYARHGSLPHTSTASAHLFIINPLAGQQVPFQSLFSIHPSTQSRIEKLKELATRM